MDKTLSKMRSERNKTIDFSIEEGSKYLEKTISAENYCGETDKIVCGDFFEAVKGVKDNSVDLLIVDPPYDLTKNFHGNVFKKMGDEAYSEYTRKWISAIRSKLKKMQVCMFARIGTHPYLSVWLFRKILFCVTV